MQNPAHCLHPMLPSNNKSLHLLLRKRGICFLFRSDYNLYKNFFLPRLLFLGLYNFLKFVIILCVFFCILYLCLSFLVPVLMYCSRLMSKNRDSLIYLLIWYIVCSSLRGHPFPLPSTDNQIICVTTAADAEVVNISMPFHVCWNTSNVISCVITYDEFTYKPEPVVTGLSRYKSLEE